MEQQDPPIEEPRYRVSRNAFITKERRRYIKVILSAKKGSSLVWSGSI